MSLQPDVSALLDALLRALREALGGNLLGVYPRGSLALGDFDPETSDVDVLVVTHRRVSDTDFTALEAMHAQLRALPNRYAEGLEVAYIDHAALRRFGPGLRHPTITSHDPLRWEEHGYQWLLERWMVRTHASPWLGPEPRSLIDPIAQAELREAVRHRLRDWGGWAAAVPEEDIAWLHDRAHQAYVIETLCRGLYALEHEGLPTKPQAVKWALANLPEAQRALVERSQQWRRWRERAPEQDAATAQEALAFVRWAASQAATRSP